jgi:membrane protein
MTCSDGTACWGSLSLITYYGFLSIFPLLLLGVAILSRVLTGNPDLRQRLISAIVPSVLRSTVEHAVTTLPASTVPFIAGLIGLLFAGNGVVFSAYQTLNDVAAVPRRLRPGFFPRYLRVLARIFHDHDHLVRRRGSCPAWR